MTREMTVCYSVTWPLLLAEDDNKRKKTARKCLNGQIRGYVMHTRDLIKLLLSKAHYGSYPPNKIGHMEALEKLPDKLYGNHSDMLYQECAANTPMLLDWCGVLRSVVVMCEKGKLNINIQKEITGAKSEIAV